MNDTSESLRRHPVIVVGPRLGAMLRWAWFRPVDRVSGSALGTEAARWFAAPRCGGRGAGQPPSARRPDVADSLSPRTSAGAPWATVSPQSAAAFIKFDDSHARGAHRRDLHRAMGRGGHDFKRHWHHRALELRDGQVVTWLVVDRPDRGHPDSAVPCRPPHAGAIARPTIPASSRRPRADRTPVPRSRSMVIDGRQRVNASQVCVLPHRGVDAPPTGGW